jgi:hypothetical protein
LIRTSGARNAKQINAPVGAEDLSLAQQKFEKYGLRASNKPCDFNHIKNPYQIPVVQRSREKTAEREYRRRCSRDRSAELSSESPAKRGDFRHVTLRERKLATTQLAERAEPESNLLQVDPCNPAKLLACSVWIDIGGLRTRQDNGLWHRDVASHISRGNHG